jgi:hypothetical protein
MVWNGMGFVMVTALCVTRLAGWAMSIPCVVPISAFRCPLGCTETAFAAALIVLVVKLDASTSIDEIPSAMDLFRRTLSPLPQEEFAFGRLPLADWHGCRG